MKTFAVSYMQSGTQLVSIHCTVFNYFMCVLELIYIAVGMFLVSFMHVHQPPPERVVS